MRRITLFAAFVLVAAGCTSTNEAERSGPQLPLPDVSTWSGGTAPIAGPSPEVPARRAVLAPPAVPGDVPTTGANAEPGERPPVMSLLATQHTQAGAKAFAVFFIRAFDWGMATISGAYLRHLSAPGCVGCAALSAGIDADRRQHRQYFGGRLRIIGDWARGAGSRRSVTVAVDGTSFEELDRRHRPVLAVPARHWHFGLRVVWRSQRWLARELWVVT